jgi:uncharacterized protein DUF4249
VAVLKRAPVVAAALALCVACERTPTQIVPQDSRIIVYSLLRTGQDSVRVFVSRVDTRGTNPTESPLVPVLNARVRIVHGADTVTLATPTDCVDDTQSPFPNESLNEGCYAGVVAGGVRPGERYELFVDVDDEKARGVAVVPALPVIHSPAPGMTLQYSRPLQSATTSYVLVRWSGTGPDRRIEVGLRPARRECKADIMRGIDQWGTHRLVLFATDTVTVGVYDVQCPDSTQSIVPAELLLTAYDTAYTGYWRRLQFPTLRPEDASVGLTEGLGVFAAAASVTVPITIVRH